jgi:Ca2+-dependent lipid-binding protein
MAFCATYYRTSIRRVRRNFRDDVHREYAKARLETDVESLEWINSFLVKFWPIYAPHICETIVASVDQVLSTSTPAFLDSIRMKFFTLGTKPPRLEHVKTYPKADDDIVLMDWKFSFTPGDRMDMTARQLKEKINPKIILAIKIGVGPITKELDVIVEDFACSGLMRVKIKLQQEFPHIEKVEICFLGKPDIDYVCKPLGGETLGFDINFIPGLESFILEMIHGNLAPIMYDPNVFPIEIAKMLAGNPVDQAIGVVAVTIHGASGLKNPEPLGGSTDPYCVVSLNNRDELGKTKTIKSNSNPRWNETIFVIVSSFTDALTLSVFDFNEFRKDKELGTANFALDRLEHVNDHENLSLDILANGKVRGVISADIRFFPILEGLKLADGKQEPPPESNTGIARFTVEQAKELGGKSIIGQFNPYAVLLLNGREVHTSKKLKGTSNPIWPDAAKEFLITDRRTAKLGLVVKDDRGIAGDQVLGTYQLKMEDMMQMLDQGKEWFQLSGAKSGRVKLQLQWKPVALTGITGGTGGYITPIGVMRFHLQGAREVKNVETMGKSDPYCRVLVSGVERAKTVTFEHNLNPDWDEVVYVPVHSQRERIMLEVMDYQNIGKDRTLGFVEISTADYVEKGDDGEYEVHDSKRQRSEPLRQLGGGSPKGKLNFTVAFYPTLNAVDPEEEEEEKAALAEKTNDTHKRTTSKASVAAASFKSAASDPAAQTVLKENDSGKPVEAKTESKLEQAEDEIEAGEVQEPKKIRLTPDELTKYGTWF